MSILSATRSYERWLSERTDVIKPDLAVKHRAMRAGAFPFLRATFYRWFELRKEAERDATVVLAVGDIHLENFGTWRDSEGRLIWGVNDFDEAYPLPWTHDLVRLSTSAHLAIVGEHLVVSRRQASSVILDGYLDGLESGGRPFVLAERHEFLGTVARRKLREPGRFWRNLEKLPTYQGTLPSTAKNALLAALPEGHGKVRFVRRVAGLGSLGRQRWVAIADWKGGRVAREAKAVVPSACTWALGTKEASRSRELASVQGRVPDPCLGFTGAWVVRRLAPDCSRVELADLPERRDETRLLFAMGQELSHLHANEDSVRKKLLSEVRKRPKDWLHLAAKDMTGKVTADWEEWRRKTVESPAPTAAKRKK